MRLIKATLALSISFIVAASASLVIGSQQPPSPYMAWLDMTECKLPCWIGIVPGKTTVDEANQLVKKTYGSDNNNTISGNHYNLDIENSKHQFALLIQFNAGFSQVDLNAPVENIWLWESINNNIQPSYWSDQIGIKGYWSPPIWDRGVPA